MLNLTTLKNITHNVASNIAQKTATKNVVLKAIYTDYNNNKKIVTNTALFYKYNSNNTSAGISFCLSNLSYLLSVKIHGYAEQKQHIKQLILQNNATTNAQFAQHLNNIFNTTRFSACE
jgi:hypothetical protein